MENKKKTKLIVIIVIAVLILTAAGAYAYFRFFAGAAGGDGVYVSPVSGENGMNGGGADRFMGVVEAQSTVKIEVDSSKTIREVNVDVGDEVKVGDVIFSYDTDAIQLEIDQLKLDIQQINSQITSNNEQIDELRKQKAEAPADMQLEYSLNIQQIQNAISSLQYSRKSKDNEIASKEKALANADVKATVAGTVTGVPSSSGSEFGSSENCFVITESGEFLIKCTVSELNLWQVSEGTQVTIQSRVDDTTWAGVVKKIDTSNTVNENNNYYFDNGAGTQSSKYYFYVNPGKSEGLFLGRHVIVTIGSSSAGKPGSVYLSEFFIADIESDPYVWKDDNGRLVKQPVTLGEYNADMCEYEITEGLDSSDYIAYPDETLSSGMKTMKSFEY